MDELTYIPVHICIYHQSNSLKESKYHEHPCSWTAILPIAEVIRHLFVIHLPYFLLHLLQETHTVPRERRFTATKLWFGLCRRHFSEPSFKKYFWQKTFSKIDKSFDERVLWSYRSNIGTSENSEHWEERVSLTPCSSQRRVLNGSASVLNAPSLAGHTGPVVPCFAAAKDTNEWFHLDILERTQNPPNQCSSFVLFHAIAMWWRTPLWELLPSEETWAIEEER